MRNFVRQGLLGLATAGAVAGCTLWRSDSSAIRGYSFNYSADHREELALVQVFDDGTQTYLQVPAAGDSATQVLDESGQQTAAVRNGAYLIVAGIHRSLTLVRAGEVSHIALLTQGTATVSAPAGRSPVATAPSPAPATPRATGGAARAGTTPTTSPAGATSDEADIKALAQQIAVLKAQVREFQDQVAAFDRHFEEVQREVLRETKPVVVHFANNSARAELTESEIGDARDAAKISRQLLVEGYTDAFHPDEAGTRLAYARALNVADILVEHGLDRHSLRIDFHAAGKFARNNSTLEGKAFNRRVTVSPERAKEFLARN